MVVVVIMVVAGIVLATVFTVVALRAWGQSVNRTEDALHAPGAHTMSCAVPPGRDPAALRAALALAGYRAIAEEGATLLVECPHESDADKIRLILDGDTSAS
jgi:hypothetical protein